MNNDYERYDFWHREMKSIKPAVSMEKLVESNRLFDEKNQKGFKYNPDDRSESFPFDLWENYRFNIQSIIGYL